MSSFLGSLISAQDNHGPSELKHIDYLDGWRGLAIVLVLFSHFAIPLNSFFAFTGRLGVDIFFVLSGMLMCKILFVKRTPLATFYKRRISRILPVFLVFITTVYGIAYYFEEKEAGNYWYSLLFVRTYFPEGEHIWKTGIPVGHLWSLNIEEHAYLFLSLLTLLPALKGREHLVLIPLGVAATALHLFYKLNLDLAPHAYNIRTEVAASHILIAAGYHVIHKQFDPKVKPWMLVLALVLTIGFAKLRGGWVVTPFLLAFIVNHLHHSPKLFIAFLNLRVLRSLGLLSFSVYLWQQPFYVLGVKSGPGFFGAQAVFLGLSLLAGALSFYALEQPTRRWLNKHW